VTFGNIVITGASSGIGAALAKYYARPGIGTGPARYGASSLNAVAGQVREAGAVVEEGLFDLPDWAALLNFLTGFDGANPIDLLIANAGVLDGRRADGSIEDDTFCRFYLGQKHAQ
jgi:NADP-dependent 3-hydroxy acid dehydrogenase YdfG